MQNSLRIGKIAILVILLVCLITAFAANENVKPSKSINATNVTKNMTNATENMINSMNITNKTNVTMSNSKKLQQNSNQVGSSFATSLAEPVTLTLYVHEGVYYNRVIPGAVVSGQDGSGINFRGSTNSDGCITIIGHPGNWSISASASGYSDNNRTQTITTTSIIHVSLQKEQISISPQPEQSVSSSSGSEYQTFPTSSSENNRWIESAPESELDRATGSEGGFADTLAAVTLTLYVHDRNINGPAISGASITGRDGVDNDFQGVTNDNGFTTIIGYPGTHWFFKASAQGYSDRTWYQPITETCTTHVYLTR